ncbi:MAG: hypothetical protein ABI690_23230 [Chloroflexota bacterium]
MPPDREHTFANAPIDELLSVLLRQLKRPLAAHGVSLTDAQAEKLAADCAVGTPLTQPELIPALIAVVTESEAVLAKMGLTFIQALDTPMDQVSGWETTAEFLELANEKSNAELRITLGAALALAFGDARFSAYVRHLASGDYGDESLIAGHILRFVG